MNNGQWTMDNGQWTMNNEQWTMVTRARAKLYPVVRHGHDSQIGSPSKLQTFGTPLFRSSNHIYQPTAKAPIDVDNKQYNGTKIQRIRAYPGGQ